MVEEFYGLYYVKLPFTSIVDTNLFEIKPEIIDYLDELAPNEWARASIYFMEYIELRFTKKEAAFAAALTFC